MRLVIPFFLITGLAPAQIVSVGVKAGVPVTPAAPNYGGDFQGMIDTGRWTVGPTIELHLGSRFSIEADALYRAYRQQNTFSSSESTFPNGPTYPAPGEG